jgi:hypothetical protein
LGSVDKIFDCTDTWQRFEINGAHFPEQKEEPGRISATLEMAGKGTAWFDVLQVYPDMEMVESRGEAENLRVIELKCLHPDAKIFYTIDGSEPSTESLPYMIPVVIDKSILLKAVAYKDEVRVGYFER